MSPAESEKQRVFDEVSAIRERLLNVQALKYLDRRRESTNEEKILNTLFGHQVSAARSEFMVDPEDLPGLLDKVEAMRSFVIENSNAESFTPDTSMRHDGQFEVSAFTGKISDQESDRVHPKLDLEVQEPDFIFVVNFYFTDNFSMVLEFEKGENPDTDYYSSRLPLSEMTDVEHRIIRYYLDKYIEEVFQEPQTS